MKESEAKKAFLKQAKPFFKRYDAEAKRKVKYRMVRRSTRLTGRLRVENGRCFFDCEWVDLFRGLQKIKIPILFTLPGGIKPENELWAIRKTAEEKK